MITGSEEYSQYLTAIAQSYNPPKSSIRIPTDEPVYEINWVTRAVTTPTFLGVEADHEAELIYFKMDRFVDQTDLANCIGIVQFKNAKQEEYYYIIPYYDIDSIPGKIIFAWDIQSPATKYSGTVNFSFKFFKVNKTSGEVLYEINTLVAKSRVLVGWASKLGSNHNLFSKFDDETISLDHILADEELMTRIQNLLTIIDEERRLKLYWIDA